MILFLCNLFISSNYVVIVTVNRSKSKSNLSQQKKGALFRMPSALFQSMHRISSRGFSNLKSSQSMNSVDVDEKGLSKKTGGDGIGMEMEVLV